jgi:hypothetical protein
LLTENNFHHRDTEKSKAIGFLCVSVPLWRRALAEVKTA